MPLIAPILPYLLLLFVLTWLFGSIPAWRAWRETHLQSFLSFSAGVLLATAFLHILPEVIENGDGHRIGAGILAGFLSLFLLEKFVMIHPCEEHSCDYHTLGITAFIGISLHSFCDGVAMGTSFVIPGLAQAVFLAILVHKMPSAFALASLLKAAHWKTSKILTAMAGFSLIIPASALLSLSLVSSLPTATVGHALNFSLGSFLYIATSDFLPQAHKRSGSKWLSFLSFFLGIVLMALLALKYPH
jgi:zinc and cadmium transporter